MKNNYLTEKPPFQALVILALPIIIGNLFQQFYVMADSAIVGRFVSARALAAIGASTALTNVFVWSAIGGGIGAGVVAGQFFGAKNYKSVKSAASTSLISFVIIGMLLAAFGLVFSEKILRLLNTPEDCMPLAVTYLRIYFIGLPFLFLYNNLSNMFNALGKSRIPLYFLIFSSLFNILLDLLFVLRFHAGVAGVAWATLIAQGCSAFLSLAVFLVELHRLTPESGPLFDRHLFSRIIRIALPSVLQQSTVSIGMLFVQSVVNGFGTEILAGYSAIGKLENLAIVPMNSLGTALSNFTAQNLGAGKTDRISRGYHITNGMIVFFALLLIAIFVPLQQPLTSLFIDREASPDAYATGIQYLRFISWFFCLIGFKMAADSVLRGSGDMVMFTTANLVNLTLRVVLSLTLAPRFGVQMVWYAVPIGWASNFVISFCRYRTGKWKTRGIVSSKK